jgi:hypothetical protein
VFIWGQGKWERIDRIGNGCGKALSSGAKSIGQPLKDAGELEAKGTNDETGREEREDDENEIIEAAPGAFGFPAKHKSEFALRRASGKPESRFRDHRVTALF